MAGEDSRPAGKTSVKFVPKNGPRGFKCSAFDDKKGRPAAGSCYTGTPAFPKNGFQWLASDRVLPTKAHESPGASDQRRAGPPVRTRGRFLPERE